MKTIQLRVPDALLLDPLQTLAAVEHRSQFLLALKYFELGQLTSGQAGAMCDLSRTAFLLEAGRAGVAVADLSAEEMNDEFRHA